ncbi:spore cortex-lytic enzyme [Paenibacillus wynnii]|uniref:spore cortex-lytic enzyme n=1 Tax=Paenibacillus wynnii TaxID=268407 RepID=UPI002794D221|nr:spore cortex-lytic enzyme [Paenibacillus wynnii]MDQ0193427.1 N-acetylmuramoyl-L-alanine amidase [Paenibacillus wynnii]
MKKQKMWLLAVLTLALTAGPITVQWYGGQDEVKNKKQTVPGSITSQQIAFEEALPAFSTTLVKYGAKGQDVYELQGRLKHLGYYDGKIDSQYGPKTLKSVKWFQWKFGMKADGVVGAKTKLKLYNATKNWRPTEPKTAAGGGEKKANTGNTGNPASTAKLSSGNAMGLSENDLKIMANAVYGEARGEPFEGQVAVAAVILNRVKSPNFPKTPSGVIFQPGAFTAVADGQIYLEPNEQARKAVQQALSGWDPSGGCIYYFNPVTATSKWIWSRPQVKTIGEHIFCM